MRCDFRREVIKGEAPSLLLLKLLAAVLRENPDSHVGETTREDLRPQEERTRTICLQAYGHLGPQPSAEPS